MACRIFHAEWRQSWRSARRQPVAAFLTPEDSRILSTAVPPRLARPPRVTTRGCAGASRSTQCMGNDDTPASRLTRAGGLVPPAIYSKVAESWRAQGRELCRFQQLRSFSATGTKSKRLVNQAVKAGTIRLVVEKADGSTESTVLSREDALEAAKAADLDLVQVNDRVKPVVCRLMDVKAYNYRQKKLAKTNTKRKQQRKEVRMKGMIGEHDFDRKAGDIMKYLERGDVVKVVMSAPTSLLKRSINCLDELQSKLEEVIDPNTATLKYSPGGTSLSRREITCIPKLTKAAGKAKAAEADAVNGGTQASSPVLDEAILESIISRGVSDVGQHKHDDNVGVSEEDLPKVRPETRLEGSSEDADEDISGSDSSDSEDSDSEDSDSEDSDSEDSDQEDSRQVSNVVAPDMEEAMLWGLEEDVDFGEDAHQAQPKKRGKSRRPEGKKGDGPTRNKTRSGDSRFEREWQNDDDGEGSRFRDDGDTGRRRKSSTRGDDGRARGRGGGRNGGGGQGRGGWGGRWDQAGRGSGGGAPGGTSFSGRQENSGPGRGGWGGRTGTFAGRGNNTRESFEGGRGRGGWGGRGENRGVEGVKIPPPVRSIPSGLASQTGRVSGSSPLRQSWVQRLGTGESADSALARQPGASWRGGGNSEGVKKIGERFEETGRASSEQSFSARFGRREGEPRGDERGGREVAGRPPPISSRANYPTTGGAVNGHDLTVSDRLRMPPKVSTPASAAALEDNKSTASSDRADKGED